LPERRKRSGKGGCPIHSRSVWLTACSGAIAVALAGCGGNRTETNVEAPGPKIERAVAEQLAGLSDELAGSLESGDSCAASQTAAQLRASVTQAINDGKVPEVYLEDLSGLTNELEAQVPECVEPPPPPSDEDDDGEDQEKKKKDKKKDGNGDDGEDGEPTESIQTESTTTTGTTTTTSSEDER
jgi:hypothetical protein